MFLNRMIYKWHQRRSGPLDLTVSTVSTVSQVYVKELRTDIQGLLEEQRANAKVYGGEDGMICGTTDLAG